MVKKKVDSRVRTLIENGAKSNHRSFFVIVGDHGKDQVVNLHYILSKASVKARPSVLWCYKKELGFSTHRKKRMRQLQKQIKRGIREANQDDPFELFISSTNIRWCYYRDSGKILGSTWGMCVLQDFEAVTPNLLARTIETVEGGGMVVLLLRTVKSLKQLYTMTMDVHSRFRTESHGDLVPRFNERFILSLGSNPCCLVLDDELNVLPISKHAKTLEPLPPSEEGEETPAEIELRELKESLAETPNVGALCALCRTVDQARAVLTFLEACSEKNLRSTVALTAARGRGKSAALGLCLAGAIAYGYSNVFVTAPSPENLNTVFEFILKGFDALHYSEHLDYEVIQSTDPELHKAVVRVNVFRDHRQTIQYISPSDSQVLSHAELVAIDEAAAIPLPLVRRLLGPYLVFMASTINGYEGTGRSLSLKLIQQLRKQQSASFQAQAQGAAGKVAGSHRKKGERKVHEERWKVASEAAAAALSSDVQGRTLREVSLETPIRYGEGDQVEKWLNGLLCLDAKAGSHRLVGGTPSPQDCELFYVDRDALFSYHKLSEAFLQRLWGLYTAAHYRNTPNDLHMLSDAPAHQLFVLLGPRAMEQSAENGKLPDILCVIQVVLEGQISKDSLNASLKKGYRAAGDLIPWTLSQQFNDTGFAELSGARVVRIATHPDVQKMGYGSRALELLIKYFRGEIVGLGPEDSEQDEEDRDDSEEGEEGSKKGSLLTERIKPRTKLPPLLVPIEERRAESLHWFGTSFGMTKELLNFWRRAGMHTVYLRQTTNDLTGEHTAIMLQDFEAVGGIEKGWVESFSYDAQRRFLELLSFEFRSLGVTVALSVVDSQAGRTPQSENLSKGAITGPLTPREVSCYFLPHDLKRLELYAKNMVDHYMVTDLLPALSRLVFLGRFPDTNLSHLQAAILLGAGLQRKNFTALSEELDLPVNQVMAMFNKTIRKVGTALRNIQEKEIEDEIVTNKKSQEEMKRSAKTMVPGAQTLDDDMEEGAKKALKRLKNEKEQIIESLDLMQYAVQGTDADWDSALSGQKGEVDAVQIKSKKKKKDKRKLVQALDEDESSKTPKKAKGQKGKGDKKKKKGKKNKC